MTEILPNNNSILLGHEEQEKVFLDAYLSGKMHHAWIIHGVEGIGKTTFAYKIARFLISGIGEQSVGFLNEPIESLDVQENNSTFKLIASQACPDLLVVEREFDSKTEKYKKEIVVDDIRKINEFMHKTSSNGNYRVVIVDGADKMNRNAQNAILKILEEPPKKTVIILTANNIGAFLPTIKSRCRALKLNSLSENNIAQLLAKFCPKITEEENKKIALLCDGSVGKAMQICNWDGLLIYEDLIALLSKNLETKEVHRLCEYYGTTKNDEKYQIFKSMLITFLSKKIKSLASNKTMNNIIGIEDSIIDDISVDGLIDIKENTEKLILDTEISNLDRKKILLYIFTTIL